MTSFSYCTTALVADALIKLVLQSPCVSSMRKRSFDKGIQHIGVHYGKRAVMRKLKGCLVNTVWL